MAKIQTFELDRWSEPDEKHRVNHIGMADARETFDKLKTHLEAHGLLPDEYFSFSGEYKGLTGELPEFDEALCIPNFGGSEGIYLDLWPAGTGMESGTSSPLPPARRWAKRRMIISECSASLPSVP